MRIAVYHDLPSGGALRAVMEQVRGLRRSGHVVDVFVPSTASGFLPLDPYASRIVRYELPAPPPRERVLVGVPSPLDGVRWVRHFARVRSQSRRIAADIDRGGYDTALVHPSQFTQAPWLLRFLRTPSVYYCHEPLRAAYEPGVASPLMSAAIRASIGRVDRANFECAHAVAVNSRFTSSNVAALYRRPSEVIQLGVDTTTFRPQNREIRDYVLTVAALHPLKGLPFLVEALACVPTHERPPLMVVSDRSRETERRRLESRAAECGVELRFRFRVDDEELAAIYGSARLVLYAPLREPFGFVPLEAMACGRPVLGVDEGGVPESVVHGETGFLARRDAAIFGKAIATLLRERERTEAVAANAAAIVPSRWNWHESVARLEDLCLRTARSAPAEVHPA